jgi:hypothetical protein
MIHMTRGVSCRLLTFTLAVAAASCLASSAASAAPFAFQPIRIQRISLPRAVKSAGWPIFARDGRHLLFYSTGSNTDAGSTGPGATTALWITNVTGGGAHCLTCGLPDDPTSKGEGEITPFPDGKRVFFGSFNQPGSSAYGVLECTPSVVDCTHARILPVDFSAAEPKTIPPGGAESSAELNTGGAYAAKLSQDGVHVGFSDIRTDSVEMMVVGTLRRSSGAYTVSDPRVINPATPTSAADPNVDAWSDGGALYEFKTFTDGGADATYVESGGLGLLNADVWSVNLKTGQRTRLTANPDYDEDNAGSPDGKLLALWSNRTMHLTDWYSGLLPVRDFIDTPASLMILGVSSSNKRCHGPIWLLPSSGDHGATLSGQPIVDYRVRHVFVTNNLTGWPQWSRSGTMLALNTTNNRPGPGYPAHAPFLLVAHFQALKPTQPRHPVSSQPGAWAVTPAQYHPVFGYSGTKMFAGTGRGTVTVDYGPLSGVFAGRWSESYANYSDNGKDFVNGRVSIDETGPGVGTYTANLTMTGVHTGSDHVQYNSANGTGHGRSTYDGHTVSGPSAAQAAKGACPSIQPNEPPLRVAVTKLGSGSIRVKVTSRVASVGPNESIVATPPVFHATVRLGQMTAFTNRTGVAIIKARHRGTLTVTAGNTLKPTSVSVSK